VTPDGSAASACVPVGQFGVELLEWFNERRAKGPFSGAGTGIFPCGSETQEFCE